MLLFTSRNKEREIEFFCRWQLWVSVSDVSIFYIIKIVLRNNISSLNFTRMADGLSMHADFAV